MWLVAPFTFVASGTLNIVPVEIPEMFTLSNSVCPSTSKSPFASIALANVETPVALKWRVTISAPK